ncbi:MAG: MFS transporter [Spirochaetaceae bacterium]
MSTRETTLGTVRGTPTQGLIGATVGFFVGFAAVSLFGPTVNYLQEAAGLSAGLAGLLVSVPNLSGSLLRIPFSAMVDRDGGRTPFLILLITSVVGVAGVWAIITFGEEMLRELFPLLLVFGVAGGAGIATFSVGISQTSYWFPQRSQGSALGAYAGIGNIAPGLFALLLGVAIPLIGISGSYLAWLGFLVVGVFAYLVLGRNAPYFQLVSRGTDPERAREVASRHGQVLFPRGRAVDALKASAAVWRTWALVGVYFTTFGGFIALTGWFPKYWDGYLGVELGAAGALTAAFSIGASVIRVAGGPLSDRVGGERAALGALLTIAVGAVVMMLAAGVAAAAVGFALLALGMGVGNAATFKLVPQEVPHAVSGAAGWVGGLGAFGGFVIPNVMAQFVRTGAPGDPGYAVGFVVFLVLGLASAALVLLLEVTRKRRSAAGSAESADTTAAAAESDDQAKAEKAKEADAV